MQAKGENAHPFVASPIVLCGLFYSQWPLRKLGLLCLPIWERLQRQASIKFQPLYSGIEMAQDDP